MNGNKKYLDNFKDSPSDEEVSKKHIRAFELAIDTKKFEIELYWKRATYFWAFIALTFAGYGAVSRSGDEQIGFMPFFLACFGFILSWAWFFANRGSKQWQENWEHQVDHLEDAITGPLYKNVLRRKLPKWYMAHQWIGFWLTGPSRHSVSKINQLISLYISLMWGIIVWVTPENWNVLCWNNVDQSILGLTILAFFSISVFARTHLGPYGHKVHERTSDIV